MATMADEGVSDQHGEQDFCLWTHLVQNNTKGYEINDVFEMVGCSHLSNQHKEDIQRDFDQAVSRIYEGKNERTKQLRLEDVFKIIKQWLPTIDMICLFVRWAKKTKYHFGTSSISTVRVLAKQMGSKTASAFLDTCRTIKVTPRKKTASGKFIYGVRLVFEYQKNERNSDQFSLERNTKVLSATIAFLENAIADESVGAMGKIGMRSGKGQTKRTRAEKDAEVAKFAGVDLLEFHKPNSFDRKLMEDVDHRFLAREFVRMLFGVVPPANGKPVPPPISMCEKTMMGYSIRMNGECQGRFECVKSLAGIALKYPRTDSIQNHRVELLSLYKTDPNELFHLGLKFADIGLTASELEKEICNAFQYLLRFDRMFSYHGLKNQEDYERKWQVLRAMAFKLWLERGSNINLRKRIADIMSPGYWEQREEERQRQITTAVPTGAATNLLFHQEGGQDAASDHDRNPSASDSHSSKRQRLLDKSEEEDDQNKVSAVLKNGFLCPTITSHLTNYFAHSTLLPLLRVNDPSTSTIIPPAPSTNCKNSDNVLADNMSLFNLRDAALSDIEWNKLALHLTTGEDLDQRVKSYLQLTPLAPAQMILCQMAPLEVYVADKLHDVPHCRVTVPHNIWPIKDPAMSYLYISGQQRMVTTELLQVIRSSHSIFQEHAKKSLPNLERMVDLTRAVVLYGKSDSKRSPSQYRVNIGCGGQDWRDGAPNPLVGKGFEAKLMESNLFDSSIILPTVGQLVGFLWETMVDIHREENLPPLAPDRIRQVEFARHLIEYLSIENKYCGIEDVTISVGVLFPNFVGCKEHKDELNDTLSGYSKTGVLNTCFISAHGEIVVHLQVIVNFRRIIGNYSHPFTKGIQACVRNINTYVDKVDNNYRRVFAGLENEEIPTAKDRSTFFLEKRLLTEEERLGMVGIGSDDKRWYLFPKIGPSRIFSFSMFLHPIVRLRDHLAFDQIMELCFVASMLNNPLWFNPVMMDLVNMEEDDENEFTFGKHPFYDWFEATVENFNKPGTPISKSKWQTSRRRRFSPFGGDSSPGEIFGAFPNGDSRSEGEKKLEGIMRVLYELVEWIDSLQGKGCDPISEIPISLIRSRIESCCREISRIVPIQMGLFRVSLFVTLITGCGMLKDGVHLRQLAFPVKKCASFEHLKKPSGGVISEQLGMALSGDVTNKVPSGTREFNGIEEEDHDRAMMLISNAMGFQQYHRDTIECLLVR
eukprot:scaffold11937_cov71-Cylindrotheca_fusiformis.AAC.4